MTNAREAYKESLHYFFMLRTYKLRLYPNKSQETILVMLLVICKEVYNTLLAESKSLFISGRADMNTIIRDIKITAPNYYGMAHSQVLQNIGDRLSKAYRNFFRRLKGRKDGKKVKAGFPRFKKEIKSLTYPQSGFKIIDSGRRCQTLHLSKIGDIKIRCHRDMDGSPKTLTIKQERSGKWYAYFSVDIGEKPDKIKIINPKQVIGLDLGIIDLAFDSEGKITKNPKHLQKHEAKLKLLQKKLSKKQKRSKNRSKARINVARQHEKVANARLDFLNKLSRYYIDNYDAIAIENLNICQMVRNNSLSKYILGCGWGIFRQLLSCKAESAGKTIIPVNPQMTSQQCSKCGYIVPKTLAERMHICHSCGLELPRDYNAAITIKNRALNILKIGQELPEFMLVEMMPLPLGISDRQVLSMKQETCPIGPERDAQPFRDE